MTTYYEDSHVTLYHANCEELLPRLAVADVVITDPPYDEMTHDGFRNNPSGNKLTRIDLKPLDVSRVARLLLSRSHRWVISFCALEMLGDYKRAAGCISWVRAGFWRRTNGAPQFSGDRPAQPGEGVAIMHAFHLGRMKWNGGGHHAFWEFPVVHRGRLHVAQKPLDLMRKLVLDFSEPNETIYDPFAGSGTTLLAARALGRKSVGIEIDEATCEIAATRLTNERM